MPSVQVRGMCHVKVDKLILGKCIRGSKILLSVLIHEFPLLNLATSSSQTSCRKLQHIRENVCLTVNNNSSLYAVGSLSVVTLIDPRVIKTPSYVPLRQMPCGKASCLFAWDATHISNFMWDFGVYFIAMCRDLKSDLIDHQLKTAHSVTNGQFIFTRT